MPLDLQSRFPVMCLTQDGTDVPHAEQAARLCAAGARWIQLRIKDSERTRWLEEARAAVDACHRHGAILIVNDSVDIALASGADGAHLGALDGAWAAAREALGPDRILGGTVNNAAGAARATESGCLDYAGIGPLRFTSTKRALAPVLGFEGVQQLVARLQGIPAWVIGGVTPGDSALLREAGAAGVAVASSIHRGGRLEDNLRSFLAAWPHNAATQQLPASLQ
jgi:thiamine-phosphate pyrophosphorylase